MKRIKKFGVFQTAKVFAVIYFVVTAIIMVPIGIIMTATGLGSMANERFGGGMFFIALPFLYGAVGFVLIALTCTVYNYIAGYTGGIEIEVE